MRPRVRLVLLGAFLALAASVARGQGVQSNPSIRIAVIGQTDSTGLALAGRLRSGLAAATRRSRTVIVPARDIATIVEQAYRDPNDPIKLDDVGELGKMVRADIVLALVPDTSRAGNVEAIVLQSRTARARVLGSWPAAHVGRSSVAILRAFQTDPLYRRLVTR